MAEDCWTCNFVAPGSVLKNTSTGEVCLAVGDVHYVALLTWPLQQHDLPDGVTFYSLQGLAGGGLKWALVLDWEQWQVIPSKPVSPARQYLLQGCQLGQCLGVM
eukprot:8632369-Lingulodinium_polyedra.AAC.1